MTSAAVRNAAFFFDEAEKAYFQATETSSPQDWMNAALLAKQHRNAIRALQSHEAPAGADWCTIDSAPKQDRVLLFAPGKNISDDPNDPSVYKVARAADFCWATHWQHLPAAPAQKQEGE